MTSPLFAGHPFGTTVTEETLRNTFTPLTQWEDKYRQLILLGKQLPALPDSLKAQAKEIAGCETAFGWGIPFMRMVLCISSATAKVALYAGCWRYYSRRSKVKLQPSYWRIRLWHYLTS